MAQNTWPRNLIEATRYITDLDVCTDFVAKLRWPDGPVCPECESTEHYYLASRRIWKCRTCKKQFSVKKGTIFEDSPIGLDKWLVSIWLIANSKNGISSHELGRSVGLTQKSAWFVLHRIRLAMQIGSFEKFDGTVEVDETYVGGKTSNMHPRKAEAVRNLGTKTNKTIVAGTLERSTSSAAPSQVRANVIRKANSPTLVHHVRRHVTEGATVFTDSANAYCSLGNLYDHGTVDHTVRYVNGRVSTNGIENFWSLLKRGIHGTYVAPASFHLHRYVDERVFTFNERGDSDLGRFRTVLSRISGRRVTYDELIGKAIALSGRCLFAFDIEVLFRDRDDRTGQFQEPVVFTGWASMGMRDACARRVRILVTALVRIIVQVNLLSQPQTVRTVGARRRSVAQTSTHLQQGWARRQGEPGIAQRFLRPAGCRRDQRHRS